MALLERLVLGVLEGEAPSVREAVGGGDTVELAESVVLGVKDPVAVPLGVGVDVGVGVGVAGGVALPDRLMLPVLDWDAPAVNEAVGEELVVELAESVEEDVGAAVPVPLVEVVPVDVPEGVRDAVALLERDTLPVLLAEAPGLSEAVGEAVKVGDELKEALAVLKADMPPLVSDPMGDADIVMLPLTVVLGVLEGEPLPELVRVPEVVPVPESLPEALPEAPAVSKDAGEALN